MPNTMPANPFDMGLDCIGLADFCIQLEMGADCVRDDSLDVRGRHPVDRSSLLGPPLQQRQGRLVPMPPMVSPDFRG